MFMPLLYYVKDTMLFIPVSINYSVMGTPIIVDNFLLFFYRIIFAVSLDRI